MQLSELQLDVLAEVCNMGLGVAAASLSEMVGDEVELSVPKVEFMPRAEVVRRLGVEHKEVLKGVEQQFGGDIGGHALLLFPDEHSMNLVRLLLANAGLSDSGALNELEQEALLEVGNIVLNATLSVFADTLELDLGSTLPNRVEGLGREVVDSIFERNPDTIDDEVLVVAIDFSVHEQPVSGWVSLLLELGAARTLTDKVSLYIEQKLGIQS